ncbi:septum formation initiator family protein [Candidatus Parcubacteria bacterium]|nr:septum formation initiator family protein [Candidatus Parcubacteria bacterium]
MHQKIKKSLFKRIIFHRAAISLIGLVVIIFISIPLARNASKRYNINKEVVKLEEEINRLKDKNGELGNMIDYLKSDQFIDEQARLNLNYKKEGEELVVIKNKEAEAVKADVEEKNIYNIQGFNKRVKEKEITNPKKWGYYFFNREKLTELNN